MNRTLSELAVLPVAILLTGGFLWFVFHSAFGPSQKATVTDFAVIENVQEKKDTFFEFMLPIIRRVNEAIQKERQLVNPFSRTVESGRDLSERDARQLAG